jgi:carboxyl-terminal processing protease
VPPATTAAQLEVFEGLWNAIYDTYVDPDFNGVDWFEVRSRYEALIEGGLTDDDFYEAMKLVVGELGDGHSKFESPAEVEEEEQEFLEGQRFVGIGASAKRLADEQTGSVLVVYPHSPAALAGLRPHDHLLEVDGLPFFDEEGNGRTRGDEGTTLALTFQRQGEAPQTVELVRRALFDFQPVDSCVVPGTRIGYVFVPTFLDSLIDDRIRSAIFRMTLDAPLDGLVLDQRENGGGSSLVALPTLALFGSGLQGTLVGWDGRVEYSVAADDVGGSQSVPLVVLADEETVSFGEIATGVLQNAGRAVVVGGPTAGNVELLVSSTFADASRAWIATYAFEPVGLPAGVWEGVGILPDDELRTRWDLFTEETDPALARAVELLQQGLVPVPAAARRTEPGPAPAGPALETRSEAPPRTP